MQNKADHAQKRCCFIACSSFRQSNKLVGADLFMLTEFYTIDNEKSMPQLKKIKLFTETAVALMPIETQKRLSI